MKILVAEDDMPSRKFLSKFLSDYGDVDMVVDGLEALDAYLISVKENELYDLICLDIMMPKVDGIKVLKAIKDYEDKKGVEISKRSKVMMTTALSDTEYVNEALKLGCTAYAAKPLNIKKMSEVMEKLGFQKTSHKVVR
ncbi:response regulator [Thermodesulfobium sp. 4217-1]|uniref:response regulator n=1 Tax=Thermodesulfobium sp. 4217-1 TaxID=3120013 RepID=UPI003221576C